MNNWVYLTLIVIVGAVIRLFGLFHDLWLDEVWSFNLVFKLNSPIQIFTQCFIDTNHHLNTLFMYLVDNKNPSHWMKYRILSYVLGVSTVAILYLISKKIIPSKLPRLITPFLAAISFPLVIYSSEARGYSAAIFFSALSIYSLLEYLKNNKSWPLLFFHLSIILGFLSHLSFLYIYVGLLVTSIFNVTRSPLFQKRKLLIILKLFFVPTLIVFMLLIKFILNCEQGGAPYIPLYSIANDILISLVGYWKENTATYIFGILLSLMLIKEVRHIAQKNFDLGIFIISVILGSMLFGLFSKDRHVQFRHFLCLYPFLLILLSHLLHRFIAADIKMKILASVLSILILFGNAQQIACFAKRGRGHYLDALAYIYRHTDSSEITITSDYDFRNFTLLNFYHYFFGQQKKLSYVAHKELVGEKENPEWLIVHSESQNPKIKEKIELNNSDYLFIKHFPYSGLFSGFHWFLYHKENRQNI